MGGATRFVTLLTTPFPPLRPSLLLLRHRFTGLSITPLRALTLSSPSKTKSHAPYLVNSFHSQSNNNAYTLHSTTVSQQQQHHPWPEWIHLLNILSNGQGWSTHNHEERRILPEDAFVVYEELPDDFVLAASTYLAFARARPDLLGLLSRRNIEAVVSNGTPFLFKSALECARRMRAFLESDGSNVSEFDKATTIDLMKYIISYASNPSVSSEKKGPYSRELVDSSVRHLLHELGTVCCAPTGYIPASEHQFSDRSRQTTRPIGQNIEMKRGDWVCSKCNFMNFARNMKCLECEAPRPKKQLTGGEWECPQCNFFNYGRNSVCLRCDCRRPGVPLFNTLNSRSSSGYNGDFSFKPNMDSRLAENEENQNQFSKISHQRTFSNYGNPKNTDSILGTPVNHSLDNILGHSSTDSERDDMGITGEQNTGTEFSPPTSQSGSSDYRYTQGRISNPVAFVPLPADMFSRREQTAEMENRKEVPTKTQETVSSEVSDQTAQSSKSQSLGGDFQFPKNISSRMDNDSKEKEQADASERWFKKIAELHDVKDHPSAISDEDFPEIMPVRKGENRFVVSKRKDRSLTSPKYKRQAAMDQATNTNFVPFVPFPPGYFARKDTEQTDGLDSPVKATSDNALDKITAVTEKSDGSRDVMAGTSTVPIGDDESVNSAYSEFSSKYVADTRTLPTRDSQSMSSETSQFSGNIVGPPGSSTAERSITSRTIRNNNWTDGYSRKENVSQTSSAGAFSQASENESVRSSWTGKSLEGSAVKEPDPLDMSEEAKAERWFKRVAQIKDISELSQIPDEDFPSIMPMRKGVNRFVVSKRKTPLERRLTSQQYRRNLPIVSTDTVKKESDNS